ncbi:hypothetical protein COI69_28215 [Bacillus cereus]|uniref:Uncharacterized protein n=2 Tax=Bacillus cereus group TaxID=86661 RepID=A0A9X7E1H6_BACCE|nr:hypothetical protein COK72_30870 [Bacillus thuringiensis]PHA20122.1 hypothetical protein COE70_16575 [Bacillus cereus]PHG75533.1 hypothetical protein COI69_28215 [Bacillus cereus]PQQ53244.1 hypothetical protein C6A34_00760 [Bacillus thuringiensis]
MPRQYLTTISKTKITFYSSSGQVINHTFLKNETSEPIATFAYCPIDFERFETKKMPVLIQ